MSNSVSIIFVVNDCIWFTQSKSRGGKEAVFDVDVENSCEICKVEYTSWEEVFEKV